jgi:hypothetical protein
MTVRLSLIREPLLTSYPVLQSTPNREYVP